jgi:hypothetical protein
MSKHAWITALISLLSSVILFGIGAATILSLPGLSTEAQLLLPVVILVGLLVVPFAAERLALRLRAGERDRRADDLSSGRTYPRGG